MKPEIIDLLKSDGDGYLAKSSNVWCSDKAQWLVIPTLIVVEGSAG